MQSSSRPPGCARNCPPIGNQLGAKRSSLPGDKPPQYKVHSATIILFPVSYELWTWPKAVPKTMDQLKRLSIPSEILRFLKHACYPRLGHPTRPVHLPPMNIHYIRRMNVTQSKCQRPWKISALCPQRTYITSNVWTWPKASAKDPGRPVHFAPHEHTQHAYAKAFPTSINIPFSHHS